MNPGGAPGYAPAPFLHILPPHQQPHSQLLHHHLTQDGQVNGFDGIDVFSMYISQNEQALLLVHLLLLQHFYTRTINTEMDTGNSYLINVNVGLKHEV